MVVVTHQHEILEGASLLVALSRVEPLTARFGCSNVAQLSNVSSILKNYGMAASREGTLIAREQEESSHGFTRGC